jgi:hypothetical protein
MQGAHEKYPSSLSEFFLCVFEIGYLYHHAQFLYQEYSAEQGYQQFFSNNDGQGRNDATQRQASRITHEYLRRIGIIPEESCTGPDECADKNRQLTQVGYVHDIELFRKADIAAGIGKDPQTGTDQRAGASCQAVQAVRYVCSIRNGRDDENDDQRIEYPGRPSDSGR